MPQIWNGHLVVTKEELVPDWFTWDSLRIAIYRYKDTTCGIKRVRIGGKNHPALYSFDSLPREIQLALGDPRKITHPLEEFYRTDSAAVEFYQHYQFTDGSYLKTEHQEQYIINASVIKALLVFRTYRDSKRKSMGGNKGKAADLLEFAISFNEVLKARHGVTHNLPASEKRFKEDLKGFEKEGYNYLISAKHKNQNRRKVTEATLELLNNLFGQDKTKPTATKVYRLYNKFVAGSLTVINNHTAEIYNPADFKELSDSTVKNYLAQWSSRIGTHAARSGNNQNYIQRYKIPHKLEHTEFAGSLISIDDRQPPFKTLDKKRVWFYCCIDLASEAFTACVYGKTKEGLILPFYQQLVRNYAEWGVNLPDGLEAEMSLNSSYVNTFLKEGAMFQNVRIEANKARAKKIERYFRTLRYDFEKERIGWLARPNPRSESNETAQDFAKIPTLPYEQIIEECLLDFEAWNSWPHRSYPEAVEDFRMYGFSNRSYKTRWEYFLEKQHPDLKPTNYRGFMPYVGKATPTSCNVGQIRLNNGEYLLGEAGQVCTGEKLISLMKQVEGKDITVYWLTGNDGNMLKAMVYLGTQYICEAVAKPTYKRAVIEQTPQCLLNQEIMSKYSATIDAFGRRQKAGLEPLTLIDDAPKKPKAFVMPGLRKPIIVDSNEEPEILPEPDPEKAFNWPETSFVKPLIDRF